MREEEMRCKTAQRLWKTVLGKREQAVSTGYEDDVAIAYSEYTQHIEEHGCWRNEP